MSNHDDSALIDQLCDEFENQLRAGIKPVVREYLGKLPQESRKELLRELLALESELLQTDQWPQRLEQLAKDLPEYRGVLYKFAKVNAANVSGDSLQNDGASSQQIGPYKILQVIGEGGMGSVYMAEQEKPVKRRVALKVIKAGLDSKQVIARFEAERQALAMMDHPSISRILDSGTTESGQPYFAMELVKGVPLNEYCDRHRLSIPERLEVFRQICEAVQHAHQKGVIHRDLKPSNILVAEYNGKPVPKIIDFGLAKALEVTNKLTDKTMFTEFGQVLGTLKYMSPEQAGLDSLDVDTRSDVYALGVILYELLTGDTPLNDKSFHDLALLQVLELVRDYEAVRPSSKLSSNKHLMDEVTKQRRIDLPKLTEILSGDLDWIVMKALDKDRVRRYETPLALSDDIVRFLEDKPIRARPPSRRYMARKFIRRNQTLVASAIVVATTLVAAAGTCLFLAIQLNQKRIDAVAAQRSAQSSQKETNVARGVAVKERDTARVALQLAESERKKAEEQTAIAETVLSYFQSNLLRQANIYEQANDGSNSFVKKELTVVEALAKSAVEFSPENIEKKFPGQPEIQANILETMADTFSAIGQHQEAVKLSKAGLDIRLKLSSRIGKGQYYASQVRHVLILLNAEQHTDASINFSSVLEGLFEILEMSNRELSLDESNVVAHWESLDAYIDAETNTVVNEVANRLTPQSIYLPSLSIDDLGVRDYPRIIKAVSDGLYYVPRLHKSMQERYTDDDHRTKYVLLMSGFVDHFSSEMQRALPRGLFSSESSLESAIEKYLDVRDFCIRRVDNNGLKVAGLNMVLAVAYAKKHSPNDPRVLECRESSVTLCRQHLSASHPAVTLAELHLAKAYFIRSRFHEALPLLESVALNRRKMLGTADRSTLLTVASVARCHHRLAQNCVDGSAEQDQNYRHCIAAYREACGFLKEHFGADDYSYSLFQYELGHVFAEKGQLLEALDSFEKSWIFGAVVEKKYLIQNTIKLAALASTQIKMKQHEKALASLQELIDRRSNHLKDDQHPLVLIPHWQRAQLFEKLDMPEKSQLELHSIGLMELSEFQVLVNENATSNSQTTIEELEMLGWTNVDFQLKILPKSTVFTLAFSPPTESPIRHQRFRETRVEEFSPLEKRLLDQGYQLIKKQDYALVGEQKVSSLWHKQTPRADSN